MERQLKKYNRSRRRLEKRIKKFEKDKKRLYKIYNPNPIPARIREIYNEPFEENIYYTGDGDYMDNHFYRPEEFMEMMYVYHSDDMGNQNNWYEHFSVQDLWKAIQYSGASWVGQDGLLTGVARAA